jgi:hypothetical protein
MELFEVVATVTLHIHAEDADEAANLAVMSMNEHAMDVQIDSVI